MVPQWPFKWQWPASHRGRYPSAGHSSVPQKKLEGHPLNERIFDFPNNKNLGIALWIVQKVWPFRIPQFSQAIESKCVCFLYLDEEVHTTSICQRFFSKFGKRKTWTFVTFVLQKIPRSFPKVLCVFFSLPVRMWRSLRSFGTPRRLNLEWPQFEVCSFQLGTYMPWVYLLVYYRHRKHNLCCTKKTQVIYFMLVVLSI